MTEDELYKKVIKLIYEKKAEMIKYSIEKKSSHLTLVSQDISSLKKYIDGNKYIRESDIDNLLSNLVQYRVSLYIPINDGYLARARKIDNPKVYPLYDDVSILSYMPLHLKEKTALQRFNKKRQSMYYGSVFDNHVNYDCLNVPFNEIEVTEGDYVNTLISQITENINVAVIGIFSLIENKNSFIQHHPIFERINDYYNTTHEAELLKAIKKVDDFFNEILTMEGNERVYTVTSNLGNIYLENESIDGIIYQSTKSTEVPNFVLKPSVVDNKIKHIEAKISFAKYNEVEKTIDNIEVNKGIIKNCKIKWNISEYKN